MNPESTELSPKQSSALQALALSNIEEGMGHNVTRAQGLWEELAQRRASLLQDSAEAQALKGQEELLAKIVEEEMAHWMQVSVLSHLHLRQVEKIKAQSDEIKRLSTVLEKQQTLLEQVQEHQQQSTVSQVQRAQPPTSQLNELQWEAFEILPGTVNVKCRTGIKHLSGLSQNIPVAGKEYFKDELAEEATWGSHHPCHVDFANNPEGGINIYTPEIISKDWEGQHLAPSTEEGQGKSYEYYRMAAQEFHKMHEPKNNKLKGGYSATANLIFQSWLKDIWVKVEDWNLNQRESMQLIKDFTAEHAYIEVEFYMGMVAEEQQTFEGLIQHLKTAFQSGKTIRELTSDFYGQTQKKSKSELAFVDDLQVLVQKIIARKLEKTCQWAAQEPICS